MNRFRLACRVSWLGPVLPWGTLFGVAACQGQVEGSIGASDSGATSSSEPSSEVVENPRNSDSSTSSDGVSSGVTTPALSAPPSTSVPIPPTSATSHTTSAPDPSTSDTDVPALPTEQPAQSDNSAPTSGTAAGTSETFQGSGDGTSDESDAVDPEFDIVVEFLPSALSLNNEIQASFLRAEAFWETVIVGDLPDVEVRIEQACVADENAYIQGLIDDLHIFVAAKAIDGVDGVLGAAGPCLSHSSRNNLPLAGYMEFDTADLQRYSDEGRLDEIITHEMGHVLGFGGVLWGFPQDTLGGDPFLVDPTDVNGNDPSPPDTHFVGPHAMAEFDAVGGSAYSGAKVPVENIGGAGTANGHWREDVMGNELMTSFMTERDGVLSSVTIAALEDMGYTVNYDAAEGYTWPPPDERGPFSSLRTGEPLAPVDFGNDVLQIPMRNVDD